MIKYIEKKSTKGVWPAVANTSLVKGEELFNRLTEETMMNKGMVLNAVEGIKEVIRKSISEGQNVTIEGFGIFSPRLEYKDGKTVCSGVGFLPDKALKKELLSVKCEED